jgi:hypothetical protein
MDTLINEAFARYLRDVAGWRRRRYQDDLRDPRNLQSAAALEALANYICRLPPSDPRLQRLSALALEGETFVPGQQTAYEIGRFHFFSTEATFDGFLDRLVELAEADRTERGQFGGPQVPGDNPWVR